MARAVLAAGDAHSEEVDAGGLHLVVPPLGVLVERVAAVDDEVAGRQLGREAAEHGVDSAPGRDHHEDVAGRRESVEERVEVGRGRDRVAALGRERGDGVGIEVGAGDGDARVAGVEGEVAAHDAEADDAEVGGGHGAGEGVREGRTQPARRGAPRSPLCGRAMCSPHEVGPERAAERGPVQRWRTLLRASPRCA